VGVKWGGLKLYVEIWGKLELGFCFLDGVWWVRSLLSKGSFLHGMGKGAVWVIKKRKGLGQGLSK